MNILKRSLVGFTLMALIAVPTASAVSPSDYGLTEGDLIRAEETLDIFIINEYGYKRLFLNPTIFEFYGHLGGWEDVKDVPVATVDAFETSGFYRVVNTEKIYELEVTGLDDGILHHVNVDESEFLANADPLSVFTINTTEFNWYALGADVTSLGGVGVPATDISLSAGNPVGQSVPSNGVNVEFLRVDTTIDLDDLTIKHRGLGNRNEFLSLSIFVDGVRLDVRTEGPFNSDDEARFNNLDIKAPATISVRADLDASSGNEHYLQLVDTDPDANSLPLSGNTMKIAGDFSHDPVTLTDSGSLDDLVVGQNDAQLAEFKVSAPDDDSNVMVKSVQLSNVGTINTSDILDTYLVVDGDTYNGFVQDDFLFFPNLSILVREGRTEKFEVFADIDQDADAGDEVELNFDSPAMLYVVDTANGFGVEVDNDFDQSSLEVNSQGNLEVSARNLDDVWASWGDTDVEVAKYRFEASEEEGFFLEEAVFYLEGGFDNVESVTLSYKTKTGTESVTEEFDSNDEVEFNFSSSERPYVASDDDMDMTVSFELIEEDSELTRFEDAKIELVTYEAVGEASDEEFSAEPEELAKDGLWTTATVLTVDSDNTGIITNGNEEIEFTITASSAGDYTAFLQFLTFKADLVEDDFEVSGDIDWEVFVDGDSIADGTGIGSIESYDLDLSEIDELIELEDGDSVTIVLDFGSSVFTSFLIDDGRFTVELLDVNWTDDSEDVVDSSNIYYSDVSPDDLDLEWLYRDLD